MKNKLLLFSFVIPALISLPLQATNLSQVYQQAQRYDAQLGSQEADFRAIAESKARAEAARNPQLSLRGGVNGSYTHIYDDASPFNREDEFNLNGNYDLRLSKSLYNPQIDQQIGVASATIEQAYAGLEEQRQSLIMRVAERYFSVLNAENRLAFTRAELLSVKRRTAQAQAFFDAGRTPITDVREAQARHHLIASQEINAVRELEVAREALGVLTGMHHNRLRAPMPDMPLRMPTPASLAEWLQMARHYNKALITRQRAINVAQADLRLKKQGNAPAVDLVANHSMRALEGQALLDTKSAGFSVGVEANVPFYTGGATAADIRAAQHALASAEHSYQYQLRLTEERVRAAWSALRSGIAFAQATKQALLSAQTALASTEAGFEAGLRTSVDVLASRSAVSDALFTEAKARNDYLLSRLNLRAAAGVLSAADLPVIDAVLTQTATR